MKYLSITSCNQPTECGCSPFHPTVGSYAFTLSNLATPVPSHDITRENSTNSHRSSLWYNLCEVYQVLPQHQSHNLLLRSGFLGSLSKIKKGTRDVTLLHLFGSSRSFHSSPLSSRPPRGLSYAFLVGFPLCKSVPSQLHCPSTPSHSNTGLFLANTKPATLFFSSPGFRSSMLQFINLP
jgi:hypothetical protein